MQEHLASTGRTPTAIRRPVLTEDRQEVLGQLLDHRAAYEAGQQVLRRVPATPGSAFATPPIWKQD